MSRISSLPIVFIFLACGCLGGEQEIVYNIDYDTLNELPVEQELVIGEVDGYFPGRMEDLVVVQDGSLLVSDVLHGTVEQFNSDGSYAGTVAVQGSGPGELSPSFSLYDTGDGTLVTGNSNKWDFFIDGTSEIYAFSHSAVAQQAVGRMRIVGVRSESEYFAARPVSSTLDVSLQNQNDYQMQRVTTITFEGNVLNDSLNVLQTPIVHYDVVGGSCCVNFPIPYRFADRLLVLPENRYLIARPEVGEFQFYDSNHILERRIPINVRPRPVGKGDIDYNLSEILHRPHYAQVRRGIEERVYTHKPPFLDAWASDRRIWLQTDVGPNGQEMVVVDFDGEPLGKFRLSSADDIRQFQGDRVYTIHRNAEEGDTIRVYKVVFD